MGTSSIREIHEIRGQNGLGENAKKGGILQRRKVARQRTTVEKFQRLELA
jgi:exopolyphosphatase/pppGpp-phosphohydrolase